MKLAIGLGSSLGDRRVTLELAWRRLASMPGMQFLRGSRWYHSPPLVGGTARNPFLNGVVLFECGIPLEDVLARCQALEQAFGRRRARYWGDRTLDLDLLLADGVVRDAPRLVLPHPAILSRPFVWRPLREVWPDAKDPRTGQPFPPGDHPSSTWASGVVANEPSGA